MSNKVEDKPLEVFQKVDQEPTQKETAKPEEATRGKGRGKKEQPYVKEHLPSPRHQAMKEALLEELRESTPSDRDTLSMSGPKPKNLGFPRDSSTVVQPPPAAELPQGELPKPPARDTQPPLATGAAVSRTDKRRRRRGRRSHKAVVALPEVEGVGAVPIMTLREEEIVLIDKGKIHLPVEEGPTIQLTELEKDLVETVERKAPSLLELPLHKLEHIIMKGVGEDRGKEQKRLSKKSRQRRMRKAQQEQKQEGTTAVSQH